MNDKKEKIRETKSVYFSLLEPFDVELLEHAKQINPITGKERNFSKYVRRLIETDMNRAMTSGYNSNVGILFNPNLPTINEENDYSVEVKKAMNSFL